MKTGIAIVVATALLAGIFGAITSTEADMISPVATTVISAILGASVGVVIAAIVLLIKKVIG
ncbi:MAG: hypothetical protein Q7S86_03635 [bacterium]|nr:hypothetical protein [bacterium]